MSRPVRRPVRRLAGFALALAVVACSNLSVSAQAGPPRFRYIPELEMVGYDKRGKLQPAITDPKTGLAVEIPRVPRVKPKGVRPWIAAREVDPGKEDLFQQHLLDVSVLQPSQLNQKIRDDLGFATGVDKTRKALVLSRMNYLQRNPSAFEVSNIIGLVQNDEVYLGQLEMRFGREGRAVHVMRAQQRAGPLLGNGFPGLILSEMVQTRSRDHLDSAKMARIILVFQRVRQQPARIRVHAIGEFRRRRGGNIESREVHVISEFTDDGDGVAIKLWTSAGERYPFMSWEEGFKYKHEREWQAAGSGQVRSHKWERPFQPFAPRARGVRPIPVVMLLGLPSRWHDGGYSGTALRGRRVPVKNGRWTLSGKDFLIPGGMWQFDKNGELVVRTPLGSLNAKQVRMWFKKMFAAAKSDAEEAKNLHDCLDVILNWAADMPQRPGAGPGEKPPTVAKFLDG